MKVFDFYSGPGVGRSVVLGGMTVRLIRTFVPEGVSEVYSQVWSVVKLLETGLLGRLGGDLKTGHLDTLLRTHNGIR